MRSKGCQRDYLLMSWILNKQRFGEFGLRERFVNDGQGFIQNDCSNREIRGIPTQNALSTPLDANV